MQKVLIIFNPLSGTKLSKRHIADIVDMYCKAGYVCTVHATQRQNDATEVVFALAQDYDRIVCIGGDGTLNEVLSGLLKGGHNCKIGYVPTGSTNDFANSLGIQKNVLKSAKATIEGKEQKIDIGSFNNRYFSYVASFGAFTKASYTTPQNIKNALGHTAYLLEGIKEIANIKPIHMKLCIGNETLEDDYIFGAISNSTSLGGILTLKSDVVDMNDGLLEILLIKAPKNIIELNECIAALTTQNYNSRMLEFRSTSEVKIHCEADVEWALDGEYEKGSREIIIKNIPDAFTIIK